MGFSTKDSLKTPNLAVRFKS